MNKVMLTLPLK